MASTPASSTTRYHSLTATPVWGLLFSLAFTVSMLLYYPFWDRFELDADEGINLIKALLIGKGSALYTQIWSDQPPLFSYLLAAVFRLFGNQVNAGRVLVLLFSAALMFAGFEFLRKAFGFWHAVFGALLVLLLPYYLTLSVSVMIGLPSLALAMLSLLSLLNWHQQRRWPWLALSALLLSLSVLIKLFTLILAPLFFAGLLVGELAYFGKSAGWKVRLRPAFIWACIFGLVSAVLGLLWVGPANLSQLLSPHLEASQSDAFQSIVQGVPIWNYLSESWPILLLAGLGCALAALKRRWYFLYLALWAVLGFAFLSLNSPVWYHQQLLVTLPLALLGGVAVGETLAWLLERPRPQPALVGRVLLGAAVLALLAAVLVLRLPPVRQELSSQPVFTRPAQVDRNEQKVLAHLEQHASQTRWLVTDMPMFAFRLGLPVPPNLAVLTSKRLYTGNLTEAEIIQTVQEYQPEQILIGRFDLPAVETYLNGKYVEVYKWGKRILYLRQDLVDKPAE